MITNFNSLFVCYANKAKCKTVCLQAYPQFDWFSAGNQCFHFRNQIKWRKTLIYTIIVAYSGGHLHQRRVKLGTVKSQRRRITNCCFLQDCRGWFGICLICERDAVQFKKSGVLQWPANVSSQWCSAYRSVQERRRYPQHARYT